MRLRFLLVAQTPVISAICMDAKAHPKGVTVTGLLSSYPTKSKGA